MLEMLIFQVRKLPVALLSGILRIFLAIAINDVLYVLYYLLQGSAYIFLGGLPYAISNKM